MRTEHPSPPTGTTPDPAEHPPQPEPAENAIPFTEVGLEHSPDPAFWVRVADGRICYVNGAARRILEYSHEELLTMKVSQITATPSFDWAQHRDNLIKKGSHTFQASHKAKSGRTFPVEISVALFRHGDQDYFCVHARDISERVASERTLRFAQFGLEHSPDATFWVRADGRIDYVNDAACRALEYTNEELLSMTVPEIDPDFPNAIWDDHFAAMKEAGTTTFEARHKSKSGRIYPVEVSTMYIEYEGVEYICAYAREITERRRVHDDLERLNQAIESTSDVVVVTDTDGQIQYVNPAFERVTGYTREEVLGKNPRILKSGNHDQAFYQDLWDTIKSGENWVGDMVNRRKDGSHYLVKASISPVLSRDGRVVAFVSVRKDVTNEHSLRRQLEQAQKMESVGRLAGGIAHDLNNLLSPVLGYAELLLAEIEDDDPKQEWLEQIRGAALRGGALTRQLLAFSRKQVLEVRVLALNDVVRKFKAILQTAVGEDVELRLSLTSESTNVEADPTQIEQILMNLTVNARDAMPRGGVLSIAVDTGNLDEEGADRIPGREAGPYVSLTITDDGQGMDTAVLSRACEPFFTTKGPTDGSGLGLSTVYGIVKQHKGYLRVTSEPERGTTVRIFFPAATVDHSEDMSRTAVKKLPHTGNDETILLVEDDDAVRTVIFNILRRSGYNVLCADSPESCLTLVHELDDPIDLLLTDIVMPGMNGLQLHERLKEIQPGLRAIYMSGYDEGVFEGRVDGAVEVDLVQKPISMPLLLEKIREYVQ